jgi:hypothetical protein
MRKAAGALPKRLFQSPIYLRNGQFSKTEHFVGSRISLGPLGLVANAIRILRPHQKATHFVSTLGGSQEDTSHAAHPSSP